jgi:hypothetical protein
MSTPLAEHGENPAATLDQINLLQPFAPQYFFCLVRRRPVRAIAAWRFQCARIEIHAAAVETATKLRVLVVKMLQTETDGTGTLLVENKTWQTGLRQTPHLHRFSE